MVTKKDYFPKAKKEFQRTLKKTSERAEIGEAVCARVIKAFLLSLQETLAQSGKCEVPDFGVFDVRHVGEKVNNVKLRAGMTNTDLNNLVMPAHNTVKMLASKTLKDYVTKNHTKKK